MAEQTARYQSSKPHHVADGWTLERLTRPSRLYGANGLRTGADGRIYVAQVAGSQVSAIDVDTGEVEAFAPMGGPINGPDDLAFDEEGNLYVTEITQNQVRVLRPNGTSDVIQGDMPVANPITYHRGRLIAGELNMGGRILELDRNGGAPKVLLEGVPMVNAFDVGPDGKLYFPAQGANEIWRIDLDGGQPEVVAKDLGVPDSVKFHPDGYIVSTQVISGQVLKIDPRTGEQSVLADIGQGLDNCTFIGSRTFVSHITGSIHEIVAPGDARPLIDKGLQWPLGLAVGHGELFVSDGGFTYTLQPGGDLELIGTLFTPNFPGWTRDVAAAGAGEWVVTTANGAVARWRPAEQEAEFLANGYDGLMGVAQGRGGELVFAEAPTGRVHAIEGGQTRVLASGLDYPTGVAIAEDGAVYVAESGAGRVSKLVGGQSETVIDGLKQPEGLAIAGGKLFVLDVVGKELIQADLDGGAMRLIATNLPVGAPEGVIAPLLGGVGDMCGPMLTFSGISVDGNGVVYVAGSAEGSVLAVRPA